MVQSHCRCSQLKYGDVQGFPTRGVILVFKEKCNFFLDKWSYVYPILNVTICAPHCLPACLPACGEAFLYSLSLLSFLLAHFLTRHHSLFTVAVCVAVCCLHMCVWLFRCCCYGQTKRVMFTKRTTNTHKKQKDTFQKWNLWCENKNNLFFSTVVWRALPSCNCIFDHIFAISSNMQNMSLFDTLPLVPPTQMLKF